VRMAALPQGGVVSFTRLVAYSCHARAVKERIAEAPVAGVAHQDLSLFTALFGDRRYTRVAAQRTIISIGKRGARLGD
jgi:hypothetical protein